jgi:prepilin-type N-terminal cleavage/methylation domain-containing protein
VVLPKVKQCFRTGSLRTEKGIQGFTLLELLVVIAVMSMIGAVCVLCVSPSRAARFEGAAGVFRDKLSLARTSALAKDREFAVQATLSKTLNEWKIVTVDSGDGVIGNDDDRQVDKKPYYLPKSVSLDDEQEIVFTSEGSISRATSNTVVLTDMAEPKNPWKITLGLNKAGGTVKMSNIIKDTPE